MGAVTRRSLLGVAAVAGAGVVVACSLQDPGGPSSPPSPGTDQTASPGTGQTPSQGCTPGLPQGDQNSGPYSGGESLRLSPDARLLAVAKAPGGGLVVHDVATGAIAHHYEVHASSGPVWLADRVLCWATEASVIVADLESDDVHHFTIHPQVTGPDQEGVDAERIRLTLTRLVASPDGQRIAFTDNQDLLVADPHTCTIVANHAGTVPSGLGLTDDELVLRVRGEITALDPASGEQTRGFPTKRNASDLRWAAGGTTFLRGFVASGGVLDLEVVDVTSGDVLAAAHEDRVGQPLLLSMDGSTVVGSPRRSEDTRLLVWEHAADTVVEVDVQQGARNVELDPAGTLYVSGADGLAAWDVATATRLDLTFER